MTLSEVSQSSSCVTVEASVLQKQSVREIHSDTSRAVLNFVIKDVMGDTANVVYWGSLSSAEHLSSQLPIGCHLHQYYYF